MMSLSVIYFLAFMKYIKKAFLFLRLSKKFVHIFFQYFYDFTFYISIADSICIQMPGGKDSVSFVFLYISRSSCQVMHDQVQQKNKLNQFLENGLHGKMKVLGKLFLKISARKILCNVKCRLQENRKWDRLLVIWGGGTLSSHFTDQRLYTQFQGSYDFLITVPKTPSNSSLTVV